MKLTTLLSKKCWNIIRQSAKHIGGIILANYIRDNLLLSDILLDVENPRFASYFERTGKTDPSQEDVMEYLLCHESIGGLATRIQTVGELHPAEAIVCCKQNEKYIVLEGNRRICACKALHRELSTHVSAV